MPNAPPRLLIVEDHEPTRMKLAKMIRESGWEVVEASGGIAAINYINSGVRPPDAALVDLEMPDEPGVAVIRLIRDVGLRSRKTGQPTRVVAYTGYEPDNEAVVVARRAGADAVITKPANLEDTLAVLQGDKPGDVPDTDAPVTIPPPTPKGTP